MLLRISGQSRRPSAAVVVVAVMASLPVAPALSLLHRCVNGQRPRMSIAETGQRGVGARIASASSSTSGMILCFFHDASSAVDDVQISTVLDVMGLTS